MKDAVATMGGLLPEDAGGRDAVHVAVFSAVSETKLYPGQDVAIAGQVGNDVTVAPTGDLIGIVDPFLKAPVLPGSRFWVYLYPRTITALSHRWSHPAFEGLQTAAYVAPGTKLASEQWLRDFCKSADSPGYETVVAKAIDHIEGRGESWSNEYLHFNDTDAHGEIPPEFWTHIEIVTGRKVTGSRPTYFSCSC